MLTRAQRALSHIAALPDVGFVRLPQVLNVVPISRSSWWAGVREGRFPAPIKIGPRIAVWRVEEIRELIETLAYSKGGAR